MEAHRGTLDQRRQEAEQEISDEHKLDKKKSFNLNTNETAVFSLDDFGELEIEDTSEEDQVRAVDVLRRAETALSQCCACGQVIAKLQHFLFRLTSTLVVKLLKDLQEQFKV